MPNCNNFNLTNNRINPRRKISLCPLSIRFIFCSSLLVLKSLSRNLYNRDTQANFYKLLRSPYLKGSDVDLLMLQAQNADVIHF